MHPELYNMAKSMGLSVNHIRFVERYFIVEITFPKHLLQDPAEFRTYYRKKNLPQFEKDLKRFVRDPQRYIIKAPGISITKDGSFVRSKKVVEGMDRFADQLFSIIVLTARFPEAFPDLLYYPEDPYEEIRKQQRGIRKNPFLTYKRPPIYKKLLAFLLMLSFLGLFVYSVYWFFNRDQESQDFIVKKGNIEQKIEGIKVNRKGLSVGTFSDTMDEAQEILQKLNEEYETENIIGYMETLIIKEPIVHAKSVNDFLWEDYNRKKNYNGSTALFYGNQSIEDPAIALFAHSMKDGTRFGPIQKSPFPINDIMSLRLYTSRGISDYRMVYLAVYPETIFEETNVWSLEGLKKLKTIEPDELAYEKDFEVTDKDKYLTLSTCNTTYGEKRTLVVYRAVSEDWYKPEETDPDEAPIYVEKPVMPSTQPQETNPLMTDEHGGYVIPGDPLPEDYPDDYGIFPTTNEQPSIPDDLRQPEDLYFEDEPDPSSAGIDESDTLRPPPEDIGGNK